jgi:archaeal type IV pilus assembly protein PilA
MKKIWKIRKNREAVSPVIATILMVAITVVLAAVLYVMVMGFGGGTANTPTGAFTGTPQSVVPTSYRLTFGVVSPETKFTDCKVTITIGAASAVLAKAITLPTTAFTAPDPVATITWTDLGGDGKISVGDRLVIIGAGITTGVTCTVTIIYATTGGQICAQTWTVP